MTQTSPWTATNVGCAVTLARVVTMQLVVASIPTESAIASPAVRIGEYMGVSSAASLLLFGSVQETRSMRTRFPGRKLDRARPPAMFHISARCLAEGHRARCDVAVSNDATVLGVTPQFDALPGKRDNDD